MAKIVEAMEGLTFGADPELFVINREGEFVSAAGLIPGDKWEPHKVEGGAVQVDGMAAEFNIDPVTTFADWKKNIKGVRKQLEEMLPKGYRLVATPTAQFSEQEWRKAPDEAKMLGCSPDFDAWIKTVNPVPNSVDGVRHAGGHIHFGWTNGADTSDELYVQSCVDLVRQLDWYLAAWSVLQDPDTQRRSSYGKAGAMRFKPYGVEYRTLSNFWLQSDELLLQVWNRMQTAIHDMSSNYYPTEYASYCPNLVESVNGSKLVGVIKNFNYPIKTITRRGKH